MDKAIPVFCVQFYLIWLLQLPQRGTLPPAPTAAFRTPLPRRGADVPAVVALLEAPPGPASGIAEGSLLKPGKEKGLEPGNVLFRLGRGGKENFVVG